MEKRQGTDAVIARLAEREVLLKRKEKLERIDLESLPEPTDEWVREQFGRLADVLRARGSAAAYVLRSLVGGRIVVTEVLRPGWRQPHWRSVIQVTMTGMKGAVGQTHLQSSALADGKETLDHPKDESIVIDFKEDRGEDVADEAKALWDQGLRLKDIGEKLGLGHKAVSNALNAWYAKRGLERPKPLKYKGRLKRTPVVAGIADEVMALVRQGETYDEIGHRLGTNRAKVARAVAYWHVQRALPVPDPRKRRKSEALTDNKPVRIPRRAG